jgi:hypothetical protein
MIVLKSKLRPLEKEKRKYISTDAAAYYLNNDAEILFNWAKLKKGPIRRIRAQGRLLWSVDDIREFLKNGKMT